jgi:fumarylpyruvate hydrolase
LIWPVPDIISILSRSMMLKPGDLIMTGTPAGVDPIVAGNKVTGGIDGFGSIDITIVKRSAGVPPSRRKQKLNILQPKGRGSPT